MVGVGWRRSDLTIESISVMATAVSITQVHVLYPLALLTDDAWHHVAGTLDGATIKILYRRRTGRLASLFRYT